MITFEVFPFIESISSESWEIKKFELNKELIEAKLSYDLSIIIKRKWLKFKHLSIRDSILKQQLWVGDEINSELLLDAGVEELQLNWHNHNGYLITEQSFIQLLNTNMSYLSTLKVLIIKLISYSFNLNLYIDVIILKNEVEIIYSQFSPIQIIVNVLYTKENKKYDLFINSILLV